jgi:hypothetical protein
MTTTLTDQQWQECPFCGHDQIEGGSIDIEGKVVSQFVSCLNCEEGWFEEYQAHRRTTVEPAAGARRHVCEPECDARVPGHPGIETRTPLWTYGNFALIAIIDNEEIVGGQFRFGRSPFMEDDRFGWSTAITPRNLRSLANCILTNVPKREGETA